MADHDQHALTDRRKALEEDYFRRQSERLKERLRTRQEEEGRRKELAESFPHMSAAGLDMLLEHGLDAEAVAALGLVPCVLVAWADGPPEARERAAVMRAAEEQGVAAGTRAATLLEGWLQEEPSASLGDTWANYVDATLRGLPPEEARRVREVIRRLARSVAEARGGFLGLGSRVSAEEQAVLARIDRALD